MQSISTQGGWEAYCGVEDELLVGREGWEVVVFANATD